MNIGQQIKSLRVLNKISIRKLAYMADLTPTAIVNIENGADVKYSNLVKILNVLNCELIIKSK